MKILSFLFVCILTMAMVTMPFAVHAQEVAGAIPAGPPAWFGEVMTFLVSIPKVGPIIEQVIIWVGVAATVFTSLSIFAQGILAIPQIVAKWAGAHEFAEKVKKISEKVLPYLQYFSVFNVQKKKV